MRWVLRVWAWSVGQEEGVLPCVVRVHSNSADAHQIPAHSSPVGGYFFVASRCSRYSVVSESFVSSSFSTASVWASDSFSSANDARAVSSRKLSVHTEDL